MSAVATEAIQCLYFIRLLVTHLFLLSFQFWPFYYSRLSYANAP